MSQPISIRRGHISAALLLLVASSAIGCETFDVDTPDEMVAVEKSDREYVAMTHDGIVVRALVHEQGDPDEGVGVAGHDFWVESVRERMRTRGGYALLEESEVKSANGHRGTRLEFGRDQEGSSYLYWMTIFVTEENVHIIDAGGRKDRFEAAQGAVEKALTSYEVKE
ncbi:MAG: hypothetical protein ACLFVJ_11815 [Persicimonas sp.]